MGKIAEIGKGFGGETENTLHRMVGAIQALKMTGSFNNAALYSLYKQIKDSQIYKALGMDWKTCCDEVFGRSLETVNAEIKLLEEYGESFLKAAGQLKLTKRELNALGTGLSEDAKAEVKRGVIKIGDVEFKIEELADNVEEFKANIDLLCKHKELEQKEKKHLEKKLEGLEKEHKREIQACTKEIADLKALVVDPKTTEGFDALFKFVERKTDEIFTAAAKLNFDEVHQNLENEGHVRALYVQRLKIIRNRFTNCIERLEDGIGAGETV